MAEGHAKHHAFDAPAGANGEVAHREAEIDPSRIAMNRRQKTGKIAFPIASRDAQPHEYF
ncbi:hypothetical protein [Variovorax sp. H27-G14]|uniref:hypothetical protein n=1 Tax=Variovorax sp. H27-G14 TaxID=3111914 RepID=UPI0038FCEAE7